MEFSAGCPKINHLFWAEENQDSTDLRRTFYLLFNYLKVKQDWMAEI